MVKRNEFAEKKMNLLCKTCYRKLCIMEAMLKELPEEGTLDEMNEAFDKIYLNYLQNKESGR